MLPPGPWHIIANWRLPRLGARIDAVLLMQGAVVACTLRQGRRHQPRDRLHAEDAALDLHDFHAASRGVPVVPLLVTEHAVRSDARRPLLLPGVTPLIETDRASLPALLAEIERATAVFGPLDLAGWREAAYCPAPALVEAARLLYARHGVSEIASAQASTATLRAACGIVAAAGAKRRPTIVFLTGIPGAGKTLCGLQTAFAGEAAFLTGNPALVHVLREALARDSGLQRRAARQRMESVIQNLPAFRDAYAGGGVPPERVVVIDEAQRCWSAEHAIAKTAGRATKLRDSEPGVLLDIMARREDGPVLLCLVGSGQEIHDGEGGLATWGAALASRPGWRVLGASDAAPHIPGLSIHPALHLNVSQRSLRSPVLPAWVDAVLDGDADRARALAAGGVPVSVVRDLRTLRARLRALCRGTRRAGLVCSSGARRLRAEGLGATLPHDDPSATARWFLDRFPDVRGSDALETAATEFFVQGLELDAVGLCWDADLLWDGQRWQARAFRGSTWTRPRAVEKRHYRLNAYRVLLTRARYATVIWVPRGEPRDPTRAPEAYDAIAKFLLACGAREEEAFSLEPNKAGSAPAPLLVGDGADFGAGGGWRAEGGDMEFGLADLADGG